MVLRKKKKIFLMLLILGFMQASNMAFADSTLSSDANQPINLQTLSPTLDKTEQTKTNIISQNSTDEKVKTDSSAVNIEKPAKKEKNFIPVTELKGGIGKSIAALKTPLNTWASGNYATGDWLGIRPKLEDHGITFNVTYFNGDYLNLGGGLKSHSSLHDLGLIDAAVNLDTKKLGLWNGGKFVFRFQEKHGLGLSPSYIGDYQGIETNDAPRFNQFNEYYYQQSFFNDHFKVKIGRQDANTDFCALASGQNFANTSFWYLPTIPFPSYPYTNMGVSTTIKPFVDWLSLKSGIFDGNRRINQWGFNTAFNERGSIFNIEELGVTPNIKNHPGNYFIGYWLHTGTTNALSNDSTSYAQSYGLYYGAEQMVYKQSKDPADDRGLTLFHQFGYAPPNRSIVSRYYGVGTQYKGLIPHRDKDVIGVGAAIADFSGRLQNMSGYGNHGRETALETFYKVQFTPWLAIQPDFQVIFHPNGLNKNAFEIGVRTMLTL